MANLNFNAQTVEPQAAFDPLPAGWYPMQIVESELKPTSNGEGQYLQLKLQVINGDHANRVVYERLNIVNKNPTAQEIAYRNLSAICHATGVIQVEDSQQLHGIPMEVKLSVRPAQNGYDASNDVKGYRAIGGGMMQVGGQPAGAPQGGFPQQDPAQQAPHGGQWTPGGLPQGNQPQQAPQPAWQQPAQQPAPQQNWQQPAPQQAPVQQPPVQQQATAPQQAYVQQAPQGQVQQPSWATQTDHPTPTQGAAPSADAQAGIPPWAQG